MKRLLFISIFLTSILYAKPFTMLKYDTSYLEYFEESGFVCALMFLDRGRYIYIDMPDGSKWAIPRSSVILVKADDKALTIKLVSGDTYTYPVDKYDIVLDKNKDLNISAK